MLSNSESEWSTTGERRVPYATAYMPIFAEFVASGLLSVHVVTPPEEMRHNCQDDGPHRMGHGECERELSRREWWFRSTSFQLVEEYVAARNFSAADRARLVIQPGFDADKIPDRHQLRILRDCDTHLPMEMPGMPGMNYRFDL